MTIRNAIPLGIYALLILMIMGLTACHLIFPYRVAEVYFAFQAPIYRCLPAGFDNSNWSFYALEPAINGKVSKHQSLNVGDAAFMDKPWTIRKIESFGVDVNLWPDNNYGPNWRGADWVSPHYGLNLGQSPLMVSLELSDHVRAVYVAVDHTLIEPVPGTRMTGGWLGDYTLMPKPDKPSEPQTIQIDRPGKPLIMEIWKLKKNPRDVSKWTTSEKGKPVWMVPIISDQFGNPIPGGVEISPNILIIEPTSAYDCTTKAQTPDRLLYTWKDLVGPVEATVEGEASVLAKAKNDIDSWIKNQTDYPLGSLVAGAISVEYPSLPIQSSQWTLQNLGFEFKTWSFPIESLIKFDPLKFTSLAQVNFLGKTYSTNAHGKLFFHYELDKNDRVPVLNLKYMYLDLDPLNTPDGNFHNLLVTMIAPANAISHDKILPWHRPADHYTIDPKGFITSLSTVRNSENIILTAQNSQNINLTINQNTRSFTFQGGPLATTLPINGKNEPVEVSVNLTGYFESFSPNARTVESKTVSECGEDVANAFPLRLDSAGSFTLYGDPLPSNPAQYNWYENYGGVTEQLWGQGKTLLIPPRKLSYGIHPFTLLLRDNIGLVATNNLELKVLDSKPPNLVIPPDVVKKLREYPLNGLTKVDLGRATASDSCNPHVVIANNAPAKLMFPVGVTRVEWTADDGHGNLISKVQKVIVVTSPRTGKDHK